MSKHFQSPNIFWWILLPGIFIITVLLVYYPNVIPMNILGTTGSSLSYIVSKYRTAIVFGLWATVIAHLYEAIRARSICQKHKFDETSTFLWTIQTFILGFPSLTLLKQRVRQSK